MQIIIVYDFLRISVLVYFPITLEKTRNKYRRPRFRERKPHFFFIVGFVPQGRLSMGAFLKPSTAIVISYRRFPWDTRRLPSFLEFQAAAASAYQTLQRSRYSF